MSPMDYRVPDMLGIICCLAGCVNQELASGGEPGSLIEDVGAFTDAELLGH